MVQTKNKISIENLLRSINIVYDADQPERVEHFRPTAKAIALIDKLLIKPSEKAFFVAAPYGSGKSLNLTYIIQLIENNPAYKNILRVVAKRAEDISPGFFTYVKNRTRNTYKGLGIALQGYQENLSEALLKGVQASLIRIGYEPNDLLSDLDFSTLSNSLASLNNLLNKQEVLGIDRILIVWDEFGRHIEGLVSDGRAEELNNIQTIAEFASRTKGHPISIALVLHQSLMNYAGKSPQSVKKEWRKIEGRFESIQYIDNSKEIYRLIAEVIRSTQGAIDLFEDKSIAMAISKVREYKLFDDFSDNELYDLLCSAWPITPVALYLLPRLSSRVAQHERTLFTFLNSLDLQKMVTVSTIYDYFSPSMSGDTDFGGTYHMWLESQSALSKTENETEINLIKTACLLGIGLSGERARVSKSYLEFAENGYWNNENEITKAVTNLIERKLFLYRKNSDSLSLWHGTDINIAERLEEEKAKHIHNFDLAVFLSNEVEPENWKPIKYNSEFAIQRYYKGIYLDVIQLEHLLEDDAFWDGPNNEEDGRIYYIISQNEAERFRAKEIVCKLGIHMQYVWLIPSRDINIFDIALEVFSYYQLQENPSLINIDPLILPELEHLTDDANEYLHKMIELAFFPSKKGPEIYNSGQKSAPIESAKSFRNFLTILTTNTFEKTPYINNEMINRKYPRKTLINARKKLVFGILERTGQKNFGLDGFTPDVSMFRTILLHTGLYSPIVEEDSYNWRFSLPEEIDDEALAEVWEKFRIFLTETGANKSFKDFFDSLKSPPYGIRSGIVPILLASGLRAFPSSIVIKDKKGVYLEDILPSTIELICEKPEEFSISVKELNDQRKEFLTGIYFLFTKGERISANEMDLLRQCYDALEYWKTTLSASALETRRLSVSGREFQEVLRKAKDPETLFFTSIPTIIKSKDIGELLKFVHEVRDELESVVDLYYNAAFQSTFGALQFSGKTAKDVLKAAKKWSGYFSENTTATISDGITKSFMTRVKMPYKSGEQLVDSLASLLIGRPVAKWDDSSIAAYEREIHDVVNRMEEHALQTSVDLVKDSNNGLAKLVEARMQSLTKKLESIAGDDEVRKVLKDLLKEY